MRKNISNLLQRGNLKPRERFILLTQDSVAEKQKGKGFLSEADKEALINWTATTREEVLEWNKYNEGWKLCGRAGIEAEFVFADTQAENYRKNIIAIELAFSPFYRKHLNALQALKKIKVVDINEAIKITNKQREQKLKNGLSFSYATHQLAFESLSDEIRKDILILDQEAEYEPSYLEDEETKAKLLNGKKELNKEAKEKYAELVADRSYNNISLAFAKEYQLHGAFADLLIMDIAKKWAKDKGIKPRPKDYEWLEKTKEILERKGIKQEDFKETLDKEAGEKKSYDDWLLEEKLKEILEDYARDNKTTIKKILKETLLKWLEEGLPYTPLVISEGKETYRGDTRLPHNELFREWLKAKEKAKETLQKLVDKGELKTDQTGRDRTIKGESLYSLKGSYKFVKEFKERVDRYDVNAGLVFADDDPEHKGEHLDRELLIAEIGKDGKPSIAGILGGSIDTIERHFETSRFFKETKKDGETYLDFKSDKIKEAFTSAVESIKDGYAKLLAFQEIFKKLNNIYKVEVDFLLKKKIEKASGFINDHNRYLDNALEDLSDFGIVFGSYEKPLKMRDNLYIEKDKIAPDAETLEEWRGYFGEVFENF